MLHSTVAGSRRQQRLQLRHVRQVPAPATSQDEAAREAKPISQELVVEFNLLQMDGRKAGDLEVLALLARESWQKAKLGEYHSRKQALSRFCLAAVVLSETVIDVLRREVRRVSPDVRVENDELREVLKLEVLKRDAIEGDQADHARRVVGKAANRSLRNAPAADTAEEEPSV